jgi:hypothetical protein
MAANAANTADDGSGTTPITKKLSAPPFVSRIASVLRTSMPTRLSGSAKNDAAAAALTSNVTSNRHPEAPFPDPA